MLKKFGKALLYPHKIILFLLLIATPVLLAVAFVRPIAPLNYIAYVASAYTLTAWCVRIPSIVAFVKQVRTKNVFILRYENDLRFQVKISLYFALIFSAVYAVFQMAFGVIYASVWYYTLAVYYVLLTLVRIYLLVYTGKNEAENCVKKEFKVYRACGYMLLIMNTALSAILFFIVAKGKSFAHGEITTITIAAFTFTALSVAVINLIKFKKYNSPVFSASKIIAFVAACVSVLTLESTMLSTFGNITDAFMHKILLGISGGAVTAFIVVMAVQMIISGNKRLKIMEKENE